METIRLDDMPLFERVASLASFTAAARELAMPKQTLSRRVAQLEQALGQKLLERSTRRVRLTAAGQRYAESCRKVMCIAREANEHVTAGDEKPSGLLRITADAHFGETFVAPVIIEYARRWPDVQLEVLLTSRHVDLVEERFDVAIRVGGRGDATVNTIALGPARVRYCASPEYVARRGKPARPRDLARHECLLVAADDAPVQWPFRGRGASAQRVAVNGRMRFNSFRLARDAARAGLGIAIFPEFACARDLRERKLVSLLDDYTLEVGAVSLLHVRRDPLPARVKAFVDLAVERLGRERPWLAKPKRAR
jgi:DNA-binding transcriptional LysR family regulator